MKKNFLIAMICFLGLYSCKEETFTFGNIDTPSTPQLQLDIKGKDATHPNGDGSGEVSLTVNADHAFTYRVDFADGSNPITSTTNSFQHAYKHVGVETFKVKVIAYGRAGVSSETTQEITVQRDFIPNPELVAMLTGGSSKTWALDSLAYGHLGVGPSDGMEPIWWAAPPLDKKGLGIYDDEYTFTASGSFTHKTNGSIFGNKDFLRDFDNTLTGGGDFTLLGPKAADYSEAFGYDGSETTEFIVFSKLGFVGNYMGSHRYQILKRTDTEMQLQTIGRDGLAWYVKLKAK